MSTGQVLLAIIMIVSNALGIIFTFKVWYGDKREEDMIPYTIDKEGKYHFDVEKTK
tara:strand:+ start:130 stop:297 length:168 start_codon:yes stop_codon:yes gene_type:complete